MRPWGPIDDRGFTLVETMVATALTLLLTAIALAGLVAALRVVEQGRQRALLDEAVAAARHRLAEDLREAERVRIPSPDSLILEGAGGVTVAYVSSPTGPRRISPRESVGMRESGRIELAMAGVSLLSPGVEASPLRAAVIRGSGAGDTLRVGADTDDAALRPHPLGIHVQFDASVGVYERSATVESTLRMSLRRFRLEPAEVWP